MTKVKVYFHIKPVKKLVEEVIEVDYGDVLDGFDNPRLIDDVCNRESELQRGYCKVTMVGFHAIPAIVESIKAHDKVITDLLETDYDDLITEYGDAKANIVGALEWGTHTISDDRRRDEAREHLVNYIKALQDVIKR